MTSKSHVSWIHDIDLHFVREKRNSYFKDIIGTIENNEKW
jgi:hypothetical protein